QRVGPAQLDAVVAGRVVAGGEHRSGAAEPAGGEVQLVGGGETDVGDVEPLRGDAIGEGPRQFGGGLAHVVTDHHPVGALGAHQPGEGRPHITGEGGVDLVTDDATNVVCLDHRINGLGRAGHC